jgi:hypothetical protein
MTSPGTPRRSEVDHRGGDPAAPRPERLAVRDDVGHRERPSIPQALRVGQRGEQRAVVGHALAVRPG